MEYWRVGKSCGFPDGIRQGEGERAKRVHFLLFYIDNTQNYAVPDARLSGFLLHTYCIHIYHLLAIYSFYKGNMLFSCLQKALNR